MHLRLPLNLYHFLPDLDAHYALCPTPNFYEIHPLLLFSFHINNALQFFFSFVCALDMMMTGQKNCKRDYDKPKKL
jgi:hypothetical protein